MGRRLRERKKKSEVKQRGPGRPKNENIPAPEVNEKERPSIDARSVMRQ